MKLIQKLGLGTAAIGRPQYINIQEQGTTEAFDLATFKEKGQVVLEAAYQQGIRYFDTAPGYGLAEQLLLAWLQEKQDATIEVATKWGYTYVANFDPTATIHEIKNHSLAKLNEQWKVSQQLLPFLTSYQIHSATLATGVLDNQAILERLADLKSTHQLKIGLTTSGANQNEVLQKAITIKINGEPLFDLFQVTYNVFDQSLAAIFDQLEGPDKRVVIKEALANGRVFPNKKYPHYEAAYQTLQNLAHKYAVGIDAIALRFCIDSLSPYKVLSGAAQTQHLTQNLKVNQFKLTNPEILALKQLQVPPSKYWSERKQLAWN